MKRNIRQELKRQSVHSMGVLTAPIVYFAGIDLSRVLLVFWVGILIFSGIYRLWRKGVKRIYILEPVYKIEDEVEKRLYDVERKSEFPMGGAITFYIGILVTSFLFDLNALIIAILILALGDSISTVIGRLYGKHKLYLNGKKTWEGSGALILISFIVLLFFANPLKALFMSIIIGVVESAPRFDDNITIPLITALMFTVI